MPSPAPWNVKCQDVIPTVPTDISANGSRRQFKTVLGHGLKVLGVQRRQLGSLQNGDGGNHNIDAPRPRTTDFIEELSGQFGSSATKRHDPFSDQITHGLDVFGLRRAAEELIPSGRRCAKDLAIINPTKQMNRFWTLAARAADELIRV
jgi:hypothetical protein